ncbi:MAG: diaminopimelate epimerase [Bacteroidaceae bacterium]
MTTKIPFTKMHGAGNDYIYVNTLQNPIVDPEKVAIKWSALHTGIGSDGLVLIGSSAIADFSMRIFNADGSEAMMCGNASRCIGKYVYDNGLTDKLEVALDTLSGIKVLKLHLGSDGKVSTVTVDMGVPDVKGAIADLLGNLPSISGTSVSVGNPHLVIYVPKLSEIDLSSIGPRLERHPEFPDRVNVEFAEVLSNGDVRMRVWERGSGITMACGTGACATAVAGSVIGAIGRDVNVIMDGGPLHICWDKTDGHLYMTGPAATVFTGEIEL